MQLYLIIYQTKTHLHPPGVNIQQSSSTMLCDIIFRLNLTQIITEPTHIKGSTLDLLITSVDNHISNIVIGNQSTSLSSDHSIITFDFTTCH